MVDIAEWMKHHRERFQWAAVKDKVFIMGGIVVGLIAVNYLIGASRDTAQWVKERRENRQWVATNKLTPESLIARCGQPLTDDTRNVFPMILRDVSYKSAPSGTVVLKFSRTSEESSNWVFMSMRDAVTGTSYETPVAKIAALSCLDSNK